MTKQKAIELLTQQKETLGPIMTFTWYNRTTALIEQIFGTESTYSQEVKFYTSLDPQKKDYDIYIGRLKYFLDACIKDIQDGVVELDNENSHLERLRRTESTAQARLSNVEPHKRIHNPIEVASWLAGIIIAIFSIMAYFKIFPFNK